MSPFAPRKVGLSRSERGLFLKPDASMSRISLALAAYSVVLLCTGIGRAADAVELSLALPRLQYTNSEAIDLALLYKNDGGNAKKLPLEIRHADGSSLTFEVP